MYIYICRERYIYIYTYRERERERCSNINTIVLSNANSDTNIVPLQSCTSMIHVLNVLTCSL